MTSLSANNICASVYARVEGRGIVQYCEKHHIDDHITFTKFYMEYIKICIDRVGADGVFQSVGNKSRFITDTFGFIIDDLLNPKITNGILSRTEIEALIDSCNFRQDYNKFLTNYGHKFKKTKIEFEPKPKSEESKSRTTEIKKMTTEFKQMTTELNLRMTEFNLTMTEFKKMTTEFKPKPEPKPEEPKPEEPKPEEPKPEEPKPEEPKPEEPKPKKENKKKRIDIDKLADEINRTNKKSNDKASTKEQRKKQELERTRKANKERNNYIKSRTEFYKNNVVVVK